ncbi:SDR family NAD(P)-dependent oxidoreductase [Sinorhizobium meliloti]|uniref:SDR family NAD(P)-dependent oxidoreductase n=1 Tax=Rhizobium meliloti TaxID=382 RepID=UPI001F3B668F|nr:SDR family NAD(P)-dependent oxidoreductase [Sinorhizobium meliloti]
MPIRREQDHDHIIHIAPIGAHLASVGLSAYQSAKFAVRDFSLVLVQEVAPLGIKVTTVQPGGLLAFIR